MTTTTPEIAPSGQPDTNQDELLAELLDAALAYNPIARAGFINHLPMSLIAARRLGASDAALRDWFDGQTTGDFLIPRDRPAWLAIDSARITGRGIRAEVADRLPRLIDSPGSQFFHAIIRLELAVNAGHVGQVADALVNWEDHPDELGPLPAGDGGLRFAEMTTHLAAHPEARAPRLPSPREVGASSWFRATFASLSADDDLLDDVERFTLGVHNAPRDFGTLHLVTGARAARALTDHLDPIDADRLALSTARAVAAAYVSFGTPPPADPSELERRRTTTVPGWDELGRRAVRSGDPHVAKLVYACLLGSARTGDPLYRYTAAHQVGAV